MMLQEKEYENNSEKELVQNEEIIKELQNNYQTTL